MQKQEWLKRRKVGSSDATVIMGCAPRNWEINTPYKLWNQKINELESEETHAMKRGKFFEEDAIQWAEEQLGILLERQVEVTHPENDFMSATLDGRSYDKRITVEVKTSRPVYLQIMSGITPSTYYAQNQHQIETNQSEIHYIVGYVPAENGEEAMGAIMKIDRDEKYISDMVKKESIFWECLKTFTPPSLTAWDYEEREDSLYEEAVYQLLMMDKELEAYDEFKKKRDEFRDRLIEISNGRNTRGFGIKLTQSFPKGRVNYDSIPELKLVDLEKYREPAKERWTISKYVS